MNKSQEKAWNCLTTLEQESLFLQLSQGKSSWEAGEILKISHYKYLEIKDRAQKFFKMFADFYDSYSDIFRPDGPVEERFRDFIYGCLEKRLSRAESIRFIGDSTHVLSEVTARTIIRNMKRLHESDNEWDQHTWALICEFDRWNNSRILPKIIQQPSAFKRRINKKHKIYIRYTLDKIPAYLHKLIKEKYYYKAKPSMKKYWICLVSEELYPQGYSIIPTRPNEEIVNEMSKFYIYVFTEKKDAEDFGFMVSRFRAKTANVKLGQTFWPTYTSIIHKAINYNQVNNIDFNVQHMDDAYSEHLCRKKRKKRSSRTHYLSF